MVLRIIATRPIITVTVIPANIMTVILLLGNGTFHISGDYIANFGDWTSVVTVLVSRSAIALIAVGCRIDMRPITRTTSLRTTARCYCRIRSAQVGTARGTAGIVIVIDIRECLTA